MKDSCSKGHPFVQRPNAKAGECHSCYKITQNMIAKKNRDEVAAFLRRYKTQAGCNHCGYRDNPLALELDHVVPIRTVKRSNKHMGSVTQLKKFLSDPNIQILCANCHRIKTCTDLSNMYKEKI